MIDYGNNRLSGTEIKPPTNPLNELSPRQRQVYELIMQGASDKEIARALELSEGTVKIHVADLFKKLRSA